MEQTTASGALEAFMIQSALTGLGATARLAIRLDPGAVAQALLPFRDQLRQYNSLKPKIGRRGLSLTSLDGGMSGDPNLESLREVNQSRNTRFTEADFQTLTPVGRLSVWSELQSRFPVWARSHVLELSAGGFFPPHRDLDGGCFRLFSPLQNAGREDYAFVVDGKTVWFEPGSVVFINTRLEHSLFSFVDGFSCAVWNIPSNKQNYTSLLQSLAVR
jgi:hypothetical protein